MSPITIYLTLALVVGVSSDDSDESCGLQPEGPWSEALEDWVTTQRGNTTRHGRIMSLPSSQGFYVSDRIDLVPPPLPQGSYKPRGPQQAPHGSQQGPYGSQQAPYSSQQGPHGSQQGPHGSQQGPHGSQQGPHGSQHMMHRGPYPAHGQESQQRPQSSARPPASPAGSSSSGSLYDEWSATPPPPPGAGKIVNRPPNPFKDQFKPSYPPPQPSIPMQGLSDRVDEARPPPHRQVSETDLYLLGAIEKLVYRVDLMEKRLRKMEENMHYLVVGSDPKPEPCKGNYSRVGGDCYHVSSESLNWKGANYACRKLQGYLLELESEEKKTFIANLLADPILKGKDYWTGGLNPGLLWIWSHSAAAVANTTADASDPNTVVGDGRCLALVHDPAVNTYVYRGQDCGLRHRYVCKKNEDKSKLGNEISRAARSMRHKKRLPKESTDDSSS